jgi:hypothetical protein
MTHNILTIENLQARIDETEADNTRKDAEIEAFKDAMRTVLGFAMLGGPDALKRIGDVAKKALKGEWAS